ncbi:Crp/Fnr family transcriptional regulator [Maribacter litopenaei]|uniref:Crp/Fnr family transcriptional regulator n=1 Tax=Maribacter litopenaei TaxID=2976127 RepID=A0ABY5Y6X9_9FLAO|nr:Crp/Fnr family transcriptional regulator [Maribacter litopenaei]UWX54591.1 Crp/Fnr family transcriptional regulator [Maribacter litopenaei]
MTEKTIITQALHYLSPDLVSEISASAIIKEIPKDNEILREGQYVKVIPIVLEGLIKVFTRHKDKELLLYYIRPKESCIMSFSASLKNEPSKVFAITEEDTTALLLPVDKVSDWINQFPDINTLFFQQYNLRYSELLDTIHHVLFDKMDQRLLDYLKEKVRVTNNNPLKLSHRQIADELGTAREVISRTMKKLETENLVKQLANGIEIL